MKTRSSEPRKRPQRDDVRAAIAQAALEEFFASGYSATTLEAIARRAGYTKGAVYSNYGSKQELFVTLAQDRIARLLTQRVAAIIDSATGQSDLARVANELGRLSVEDEAWNVLAVELTVHAARDPEAAEIYREIAASLVSGISTALSAYLQRTGTGNAEQIDVDLVARLIISVCNTTSLNGILDPGAYDASRRAELFRIVLDGARLDRTDPAGADADDA